MAGLLPEHQTRVAGRAKKVAKVNTANQSTRFAAAAGDRDAAALVLNNAEW
ncbi:hypothetical protein [Roseibium litorale]|uniref:hypothetical protein n=1 Tax=Roseibium litorale TaxID=2803841 RepID=UPI001FEB4431|nr:hypothetical protein [Roseibium litorale]